MAHKFSLVILVCLNICCLGINQASGLMCYQCNTGIEGQEDCESLLPTEEKYLEMCNSPMNVSCRIQEQWIEFSVLDQVHEKRTIRQCASTLVDDSRPCYYRTGFGGKTNVCYCNVDGCNHAAKTSSWTFLASVIATLCFKILV